MTFLKYLLSSVLSFASAPDGWFEVEKVPKGQEMVDEEDRSIWVLFTKELGEESIQIRFPADPSYQYSESGELQIRAERDGELFELTVGAPGERGVFTDLFYQSEGKWTREHFVQTEHHLYHFKSSNGLSNGDAHQEFINSFSIEKTR